MPVNRFKAVLLMVGVLLARPVAASPQSPDPADELARIDAAAPPDAELVITVHRAATARKTPAGAAAASMLVEAVGAGDTGRTWAELACVLGWTPDEAFDELLGRHVTFVARRLDLPAPGGARSAWGLVGQISTEAEERLRDRLKPVPREIVGGTTVLSIESGKYRMAICSHPSARRDATPDDGPKPTRAMSTYVLVPAARAGAGGEPLLDELIHRLVAEPVPGARERPLPQRGCATVLVRRPPALGGPPFTLTLTAALDGPGTGMDVRLACTGVSDPGLDQVTPWSDAAIRALSDDAFLATMGVVGLSPFRSAAEVLGLPPVDFAPEGFDALLGQRVALIVREAPAGQLAPAPPPAAAQAADRGFEAVLTAAGAARRPLSITIAWETTDLARTIPRADALAARFTLGGPAPVGGLDLVAFDSGAPQTSIRELPLGGPAAADWGAVIGEEPLIRWAYARDPALRRSGPPSAPAAPSTPERGWWIVGLAPGGAPTARGVESVRAALVRAASDASEVRRISAGFARPRAIERWAVSVHPRFAPFVHALRRVDSVRWDAWLTADGGIEGRAAIRWDTPGPRR